MTEQIKTQLVILGGGPGGYAAAFYAADLGIEVTLIDKKPTPGGVCLYQGCIPSKALLHVAKILDDAREATAIGVEFSKSTINRKKILEFKDGTVKKLTMGLKQLARARQVNFIQGEAHFTDPHNISIKKTDGTDAIVNFAHAVIATGSTPTGIPGIKTESDRIWDSTAALELQCIPTTLLVVGGGYIGLELGSVYASLGSKVSVIEMTDGILPGVDRDIATILQKRLKAKFSDLIFNARVTGLSETQDGVQVSYSDKDNNPQTRHFDNVLISTGRKPRTTGFGLEAINLALTDRGFIKTAVNCQTSIANIYAIGDVAGNPMLAHKAAHEARVAIDAITGKTVEFKPKAIPAVVFTDPEIAWCGLTETEAEERSLDVAVVKFPWAASGRAMTLNRTEGLTKLIIDKKNDNILGMALVGPGAGDMIAEGVVAIEMCATAADLKLCIHPHPTLSETMMEAADLYFGSCTHIYKRK